MSRHKTRRAADIDITPLIDVLFMLIIFFVLTASFVQGKIEVELPAGTGESSSIEGAITVSVKKDGAVSWAGKNVTKNELASLARDAKGRDILLAGDRDAPYGVVAEVLSILRREGVTSAGLLMQGGDEN